VKTVIVVSAGEGPPVEVAGDVVVAADGGLERALAIGLRPDVVVGDLDSVDATRLSEAERDGVEVVRYPAAKDATDLELALDHARGLGAGRVVVVASGGGRLDHLLASCLGLAAPALGETIVDAHVGDALVHVVRGTRRLRGVVGETLTLLAVNGDAQGVRTSGLLYPLAGETLEAGSSRGVSNVLTSEEVEIAVERGVVLAIRPGAER